MNAIMPWVLFFAPVVWLVVVMQAHRRTLGDATQAEADQFAVLLWLSGFGAGVLAAHWLAS